MKTKYFLDTEFIERPGILKLISIGIVDENNRQYYAVSNEFDYHNASEWVKENVIASMYKDAVLAHPSLELNLETFNKIVGISEKQIAAEVINLTKGTEPEFWGYYADFDWVIFSWLFGPMVNLPKGYPMYCKDLKQLLDDTKVATKLPDPIGAHNALVDALWNKKQYESIYTDIKKNRFRPAQ